MSKIRDKCSLHNVWVREIWNAVSWAHALRAGEPPRPTRRCSTRPDPCRATTELRALGVHRGDDHARAVNAQDQVKMTDAAPVDVRWCGRLIASRHQFATEQRATGRASP